MKRSISLLFIAFLFCNSCLNAQYEVDPVVLVPTGNYYPYLLKPGVGFEFKYMRGSFDSQFKYGGMLSFYYFKPTQDTFSTYAIGSGMYTQQLLPGYDILHSYSVLSAGGTCTYAILDNNISPVIGVDILLNMANISEDNYIETIGSTNDAGGDVYSFSLVPHLGIQFIYDDRWLFSAGAGYGLGFGSTAQNLSYIKFYLGVAFYP